jgi:hypothetical protein
VNLSLAISFQQNSRFHNLFAARAYLCLGEMGSLKKSENVFCPGFKGPTGHDQKPRRSFRFQALKNSPHRIFARVLTVIQLPGRRSRDRLRRWSRGRGEGVWRSGREDAAAGHRFKLGRLGSAVQNGGGSSARRIYEETKSCSVLEFCPTRTLEDLLPQSHEEVIEPGKG